MRLLVQILFALLLAPPSVAQAVDLVFSAGDGTASQELRLGLDPTATDGIDAPLREAELPPLPPSGVFEARFVGAEVPADLGQGSYRDYRAGAADFEGSVEHAVQWQLGTGAGPFVLGYNLPEGVTVLAEDFLGGVVVSATLTGAGELPVTQSALTQLKLTVTYGGTPPINTPPEFTSSPVATAVEGGTYSYAVVVSDDEGDPIDLSAPTLPGWLSFTDNGGGTGTLSGTPTTAGDFAVVLRASDGTNTLEQRFTIAVEAGPNTAPEISSVPVTTGEVGTGYSYTVTASDAEGDPVSLTAPTLPGWLSFTDDGGGTGTLSGTPTTAGGFDVVLRASDGALTEDQRFTITVADDLNTPPSFASSPETSAQVGSMYSYRVAAMDTDGDVLALMAPTLPGWLSFTDDGGGTGTLSGTPTTAGDYAVVLRVSDGAATAEQRFTVTAVGTGATCSTSLTGELVLTISTGLAIDVDAAASRVGGDVDGDTVCWSGDTGPFKGGRWIPSTTASLDYSLSSDGAYSVAVSGTPDEVLPTLVAYGEWLPESVTTRTVWLNRIAWLVLRDLHEAGAATGPFDYFELEPSIENNLGRPVTSTYSLVFWAKSYNGEYVHRHLFDTWAPVPNPDTYDGPASRSFSLSHPDQIGSYVLIMAHADNGNRSYGALDGSQVVEQRNFGTSLHEGFDVYPAEVEIGGETSWSEIDASFHFVSLGEPPTASDPAQTPGGAYNPCPSILTLREGANEYVDNPRASECGAATPNTPPEFTSAAVTAGQSGASYTYAVTATDEDGDPLTLSAPTLPSWLSFTDDGGGAGVLSGTPTTAGDYDVVLRVTDGVADDEQRFTIAVAEGPPASGAAVDLVFSLSDGAADLELRAGLDPTATDGLDGALGEAELPPFPPAGVFEARFVGSDVPAELGQGSYRDYRTGTANFESSVAHAVQWQLGTGASAFVLGYDLPERVTVLVEDFFGGVILSETLTGAGELRVTNSALTQAKLTVTYWGPVNTPPGFTSEATATATENEPFEFVVAATDGDGDPLSFSRGSSLPGWLSLDDNSDGTATLSGTPTDADVGETIFDLVVSDGKLMAEQAFTLTVRDVNNSPGPTDDTAETAEDTPVVIAVLENDADPDGADSLTVTAVSGVAGGGAVVNDDGTVTFTPAADFFGEASFTYTVEDGAGPVGPTSTLLAEATADVVVTVTPVNDAPTASTVTAPVDGSTVTLAGDPDVAVTVSWSPATDAEGDPFTYRWELSISNAFSGFLLSVATSGTSTTFTQRALADALAAVGFGSGATVTLYHRVTTSDGSSATTGPLGSFVVERGALTASGDVPARFALVGGYPNPTTGGFTVRLDLPAAAAVRLDVFDVLGRRVHSPTAAVLSAGAGRTVELGLGRLGAGTYLYRVTAELGAGTETASGWLTVAR